MTKRPLLIGTRASPLALAQADLVRQALIACRPALAACGAIALVPLKTTGDKVLDRPLADLGGKGLFTRELDDAQLQGRIDLGVHSTKDVPTWLPDGLVLAAYLPRADVRDAFIGRVAGPALLPAGATVGTASLRRQAQIRHRRPDLRVVPIRGNVGTRLAKVAAGEVDATLLAAAGLARLGLGDRATALLEPEEMLPAVGQGAIGITCRSDDDALLALLAGIDDAATHVAVTAERAMLAALDGSCRTPIGGYARLVGDRLLLDGLVARADGSGVVADRRDGDPGDAAALGHALGLALRARADPAVFDA